MSAIITYDLSSKWTEVKDKMIENGYSKTAPLDGAVCNLPNTTLYHSWKPCATMVSDLKKVCDDMFVTLNRCVATPYEPDGWALYGTPL